MPLAAARHQVRYSAIAAGRPGRPRASPHRGPSEGAQRVDGDARGRTDHGDIGAKTGTAEVSDGEPGNGWLVAHRGNVAVACVVEQGVTGGGSAGTVLHSLPATVGR